jgi:beta-lactamase class A
MPNVDGFLAFCAFSVAAMALFGSEPPETVARIEAPVSRATPVPPMVGGSLEERLSQLASVSLGEYGVAVFDARSGRTAEVSAGREFEAASLAKLPVMLALYSEAAGGDFDLDEKTSILPGDMTVEGAGVLHTYPAGYRMTLRECAKYLIKESDNMAWLMLERRLGGDALLADYESRTTAPEDAMLMLRAIAVPIYTKPSLSGEMLDMMTGTAYEGRIPEPLPEDVRVAHKVGTLGDTHSDAGIVFDEGSGGSESPVEPGY